MRHNSEKASSSPVKDRECTHYWIIETAGGPISRGVCKFCCEKREFNNSWFEVPLMSRSNRTAGLPDLIDVESDMEPEDAELEESNASV
ncbi:hypothetical protein ACFLXJ_06260 [Chloroflexota bacterium]